MKEFTCDQCPPPTLDRHKRVKYTRGLVMGVDEFLQEQVYLLENDRIPTRALHGYGTAFGLDVKIVDRDGANVVRVEPGLAFDPHGRRICVHPAQCANLDTWLSNNTEEVGKALGSVPGALSLYVVLCHAECPTDMVPLPGGPCRLQDDTMAASRIADDFRLKLSVKPPPHVEEKAVRRFGRLLARIEITDSAAEYVTEEELLELVRALVPEPAEGEPPSLPDEEPEMGSLPAEPLYVHPDDAHDMLVAAWRVWVTEVRPRTMSKEHCGGAPEGDDCVLLAELAFDVEALGEAWGVGSGSPVEVIHRHRPLLLTTRLLQEMIGGGRDDAGDHDAYLLVDGTRALGGDWSAGDNRIRDLAPATSDGDAVRRDQAIKVDDPAGGDLDGTYPDPTVRQLQGNAVANDAPANAEVLTWNAAASEWAPAPAPGGGPPSGAAGGDLSGTYPDPAVRRLQGNAVANDAPANAEVLTWNAAASEWAPAPAPAPAPGGGPPSGPAGRDLSGTYPDPTVRRLQGNAVANDAPGNAEVLTWNAAASEWAPAPAPGGGPPSGAAGGDLSGTYPDPTVAGLQTREVVATAPTNRQVLTWRARGKHWEPADNVVTPLGAGIYGIVAAGYFDVQGTTVRPVGPVYNGMTVRALRNPLGDFNLRFRDYAKPPDEPNFMYIVKGTIAIGDPRATFQVVVFQENEIRVRILDVRDNPIRDERGFRFMVEISAYGNAPNLVS